MDMQYIRIPFLSTIRLRGLQGSFVRFIAMLQEGTGIE